MTVTRPGDLPWPLGSRLGAGSLRVAPPAGPALALALTLLLAAPVRGAEVPLTGVVRDVRGEAVAGAAVSLRPAAGPAEGAVPKRPPAVAETRAQPDGTYRLVAPGEGFWTLVARSGTEALAEARLWPLLEPGQVELAPPPVAPRPAGRQPARLPVPPRRVVGRVLTPSNTPLPGAWVWPDGDPGRAVVTGADGRFVLSPGPDGSAGLRAAARGFRTVTRDWPGAEEAESGGFSVSLRRTFTLIGTVADARGRPVVGADVRVQVGGRSMEQYLDRGHGPGYGWARTGAEGGFTIPGLDSTLSLAAVVRHPDHPPAAVAIAGPGRWGPREPGEAVTLRVTLPPACELRGRAVGSGGEPIAGARVVLVSDALNDGAAAYPDPERPGAYATATDAAGTFRIAALPPGPCVLEIEAAGYATRVIEDVEIPEGVLDLGDVEIPDEALVEGWVSDPAGEPIAGASVELTRWHGGRDRPVLRRLAPQETGAAGEFRLETLESGAVLQLSVAAEGFLPFSAPYTVPEALGEPLEIVLTPQAQVVGRVVDREGRPVTGAAVSARIMDGRGIGAEAQTTSDAEGRFTLQGLAEGEAVIGARAAEHASAEPRTVRTSGGRVVRGVELVLGRGGVVSGSVFSPSGEPVAGARVSARGGLHDARTDEEGRYRLAGLEPGEVTVTAWAEGFVGATATVEAGPAETTLDLVLGRGVRVSGRVVRAGGEPLSGSVVGLEADPFDGSALLGSGPNALTRADGSFEIAPVGDGEFRLVVFGSPGSTEPGAGEASWRYDRPEPVVVAGAPIVGLLVRLPPTAAVRGRILGLGPEELARVEVVASRDPYVLAGQRGVVSPDGSFVIPDLLPGTWQIRAGLEDGRGVVGRIEVEAGMGELWLDLAFDPSPGLRE